MGLLDYIFPPPKKREDGGVKKHFLFTNSGQVDSALRKIDTLSSKERVFVKEIIMKHFGWHGLTGQNYKDNVIPDLYKLVAQNKISQVDYERLKKLAN